MRAPTPSHKGRVAMYEGCVATVEGRVPPTHEGRVAIDEGCVVDEGRVPLTHEGAMCPARCRDVQGHLAVARLQMSSCSAASKAK